MTEPLLSILIPLYNQENLIVRALDSIPRREDLEVIVSDDGSSDNSLDVLMDYKEHRELKMIVMWNPKNMGAGYNCNRLLDVCTGKYVYELDSDDYLYTEEFEKALDELDGTDLVYVNGQTNLGDIIKPTPETKMYFCAPWTKFIRRGFLGKHRFPEDQDQPDWFMNNEIQALPHTEKYTDLLVYKYNFPREGSITWNAMQKGTHH